MKTTLAAFALCIPMAVFAAASEQGCKSSGDTAAGCSNTTVTTGVSNTNTQEQSQRQNAVGIGSANASGGSSNATGGASNATGGNANASGGNQSQSANASNGGVSVTTNEARQVGVAPNVNSFPTANCRISLGASAGWLGGAFGFSSSVVDETCEVIEVSKQLNQLGVTEAAVQAMCHVEKARKAMEAVGVKCRIGQPEAAVEPVRP